MAKLQEMAVNIVAPFKAQRFEKLKHLPSCLVALHTNPYLLIRLPDRRLFKLFLRCTILALFIVSLPLNLNPFLSTPLIEPSIEEVSDKAEAKDPTSAYANHLQTLPLLFQDLANEGLLVNKVDGVKHKAVFVINGVDEEAAINRLGISIAKDMEFIPLTDLDRQMSIDDHSFDFAFAFSFREASKFIDRTLKPGGIAAMLLSDDPSTEIYKPSNYHIAYMRQFNLIAVAMKKTGTVVETKSPTIQRKLLRSPTPEAKKAALEKLEDVLFEPPRSASLKSSRYLKRMKYLPDLMGDSLESYPRRVFVDVRLAEKGGGTEWFRKHYPRSKEFEVYKVEIVNEESTPEEVPAVGMSDWLKRNVKDEEYVVMKAEADVVEDVIESKAIKLIDELFLECKPESGYHGSVNRQNMRSRRRCYWECLALYGRIRDEGVAVHQWWG